MKPSHNADEELIQAAACVGCFKLWILPDALPDEAKDQFPLVSGPWENPCPECGGVIWVTATRPRSEVIPEE